MKVRHKKREEKESGLCGIWKDERPAAVIIKESRQHFSFLKNNPGGVKY